MNDTIEKLEQLKADREATIKQNQGHIESLQDDIDRCRGEITGLELAIKLCAKDESQPATGTPVLIGKYATMGLTAAIMDVIAIGGGAAGLTATEIVKALESEGFKTKAKGLYNSVYGVAMGLLEQGKIKEGKKDGRRAFVRKQPF